MKSVQDIVARLWNLCNVLKDDGVIYHQYVTELTYLLFLKMARETGTESQIPVDCRWESIRNGQPELRLQKYRYILERLGESSSPLVSRIFAQAATSVNKPITLSEIVDQIDGLEWFSIERESLGDLYEGLLQKNAEDKKSGAGQYFTPRVLIESIVRVLKPALGDVIQDPAAGTGGFLNMASQYIRELPPFSEDNTKDKLRKWTPAQQRKFHTETFFGMEHVQEAYRLALMNSMLHGLESDPNESGIFYGDTLSNDHLKMPRCSLSLSNPPFGTKVGGGLPSRPDLPFRTSNKQLAFLQHIYCGLLPGGRAAVIVPDNVLFEGNIGRQVRRDLMDKCNLHTILRLPTGIFYAAGVKTNVLFFSRGGSEGGNTDQVWIYDLRTGAPQFGKRTQLTRAFFEPFEKAFGSDPQGASTSLQRRVDEGEFGRFRCFSRQWIADRDENLDIQWLGTGANDTVVDLPEPSELVNKAIKQLELAIGDLRAIVAELG